MKKVTPAIFIIMLVLISSCSDDDSLGNRLDHIRFYDFIYPGSGFAAEKQFHYDDQGRISKTISTNLLDHVYISDYTYSENLVTVHSYSEVEPNSETRYRLKFNDGLLTRFVITQHIMDMNESDSVDFFYEAGKLTAVQYGEVSYPVTVDDLGNVTSYQLDDNVRSFSLEYDNHPNPHRYMPVGFIFLSFTEGIGNQLRLRNIIDYFSRNNVKVDDRRYSYQDGKVVEIKNPLYQTWAKYYYK